MKTELKLPQLLFELCTDSFQPNIMFQLAVHHITGWPLFPEFHRDMRSRSFIL